MIRALQSPIRSLVSGAALGLFLFLLSSPALADRVSRCNELLSLGELNLPAATTSRDLVRKNLEGAGHSAREIAESLERVDQPCLLSLPLSAGQALKANRRLTDDQYRAWAESPYPNMSIRCLPQLSELSSFEPERLVHAYLNYSVSKDTHEMHQLLAFMPLWTKSEANIRAFLAEGNPAINWHWFLAQFPPNNDYRKILAAGVESHLRRSQEAGRRLDSYKALDALVNVPAQAYSAGLLALLAENWVNFEKYKPITIPGLSVSHADRWLANSCPVMINGHMQSLQILDPGRDFRHPVMIQVNGVTIGSLKFIGENSMLALRNVRNENGDLILVMGGVYRLPKDLVKSIREQMVNDDEDRARTKNVDSLSVQPMTFVMNWQAFSADNDDRRDLRALADCAPTTPRTEVEFALWPVILEKLAAEASKP